MGTSGPASAHASSEVNRTTASAGSSSEVGTTVVIVEALCYRKEFKTLAFAAEQRERERERERNPRYAQWGAWAISSWNCFRFLRSMYNLLIILTLILFPFTRTLSRSLLKKPAFTVSPFGNIYILLKGLE
jgi:hypothetical protein